MLARRPMHTQHVASSRHTHKKCNERTFFSSLSEHCKRLPNEPKSRTWPRPCPTISDLLESAWQPRSLGWVKADLSLDLDLGHFFSKKNWPSFFFFFFFFCGRGSGGVAENQCYVMIRFRYVLDEYLLFTVPGHAFVATNPKINF